MIDAYIKGFLSVLQMYDLHIMLMSHIDIEKNSSGHLLLEQKIFGGKIGMI